MRASLSVFAISATTRTLWIMLCSAGRGRATDALERLKHAEGLVNDGHRERFVGVEVVV